MRDNSKIKIALCQLSVTADKAENIKNAETSLKRAASLGCDIAVLPEMFNCPYDNDFFYRFAESYPGETTTMLSESAKKAGIYIIGGSIPEKDYIDNKLYNSCFSFNRNGDLLGIHKKIHLFDIDVKDKIKFFESNTFSAGNKITVFDTEFCKAGVAICYDMRFPELIRAMTLQGARLVFVPAAFNMVTGPAHWHTTNKARALDNQIYLASVSPARNPDNKYIAFGHSMITDPWGQIVSEADEKESIIISDISLDYLDKIREELPLLKHRKPAVYLK